MIYCLFKSKNLGTLYIWYGTSDFMSTEYTFHSTVHNPRGYIISPPKHYSLRGLLSELNLVGKSDSLEGIMEISLLEIL